MWCVFRAAVVVILWVGCANSQNAPSRYEQMLGALGEPGQLFCEQGLLTTAERRTSAEGKAAIDVVMATPAYDLDFTEADGAHVSDLLLGALAKVSDGTDPSEAEMFQPRDVYNSVVLGNARFAVLPEHAIDVTAIYLVLVWAAREGDPIARDEERLTQTVAAVRDQVALSEAICFTLGGKGEALRADRDLMLAREGILFDALLRIDENSAGSLSTHIGETSGKQIEGLVLGPDGFSRP